VSKKKPSKSDDSAAPSFEECLAELEAIVGELESGKLGLSEALERYEQGMKHMKACHELLARAERKIELLSGIDAEGNPITRPFDEDAHATLEEKAAARGKRRSGDSASSAGKRSRPATDIDDPGRLF
jgi:exodeoxyribonuclease VII small subunit